MNMPRYTYKKMFINNKPNRCSCGSYRFDIDEQLILKAKCSICQRLTILSGKDIVEINK